MKTSKIIAANITYSGFTRDTRLLVEFKHTGTYYFFKQSKSIHILSGIDSALKQKARGKKIYVSGGQWVVDRLAIPCLIAVGKMDWWYIDNPGDYYQINKISKYAKRLYAELSKEEISVLN